MNSIDTEDRLASLIASAIEAGADAADTLMVESASLSVSRRMDKPERLERAESVDIGLRVFVGRRQAVVSTTDLGAASIKALVARAVAMARVVPEDEFAGLAEPEQLARDWPELDLLDLHEPSADMLVESCREAEGAALAVAGITNSDGVEASWGRSRVTLAASNGFAATYAKSRHGLSVSVIAGANEGMERDYDHTSALHRADLTASAAVGRSAAERTIARLSPRKIASAKIPVVFDPRVASGLVATLAGALSGTSIARGVSFLKDAMGTQILPAGISIIDDPFLHRGLRSRPFDGEGIASMQRPMVHDGYLASWFLDLRAARQLGLVSTGHASRGTGGQPGPAPTNLYLTGGRIPRGELLSSIGSGFYVTEVMGPGVNTVTGDYSRGASGFWFENGEMEYPVSEVTIAGNLRDMLKNLIPANDLAHRYGIDSPTLAIEGMTVAGL